MHTARSILVVSSVVLALGAARAQEPANDPQNPRGELESLAVELDAAVRRVSQPGVEPILGSEPARGYYVPGLGAMFVVPPRSIPREERFMALRAHPRNAPAGATSPTSDPEYPELAQLLGPESAREFIARRQLEEEQTRREIARNARQRRLNSPQREAEMRRLEQQVTEFQKEAELAHQQAEQAWAEIMDEIEQRANGGTGSASRARAAGGGSAPATAPTTAAAGRPAVREQEPSPPWRFWFGTDNPEDARSPAQILGDVRAAIVDVLEAHGAVLRNVGPQEQVTVAVDFLPRGLFVGAQRPARTLVVRVKKQFLEERQAGRLSPENLRAKLEISEY